MVYSSLALVGGHKISTRKRNIIFFIAIGLLKFRTILIMKTSNLPVPADNKSEGLKRNV